MSTSLNPIYGWKPDLPDLRDHIYKPAVIKPKLPSIVDMRSLCPPIYDQGNLGSCVANATAGAFEFERMRQHLSAWIPSRLFIYYNGRVLEKTTSYDSGLYVRDGIKTIAQTGACIESVWPYDVTKFKLKPTQSCYDAAKLNEATTYQRITDYTTISTLKQCLFDGYPFIMGFTVYSSFESSTVASTGMMPMPNFRTEQVLGGHSVMCVGYNDSLGKFIMRNSWGTGWGDHGYFYMPYAYMTNSSLCDDFWTIRLVSGK